jgi:hypothetical protein
MDILYTRNTWFLSQVGHDSVRFRHATQNGVQFTIYELFNFGISHLIFLDCGNLGETNSRK